MKRRFSFIILLLCLSNLYSVVSELHIEDFTVLEKKCISLNCNWDFYWGRFVPLQWDEEPELIVSVPSRWNDYDLPEWAVEYANKGQGSGTYRLKITGLKPDTNYSFLTYKAAYTAFKVYAYDKLIFTSGQPEVNWEKTKMEQYNDFATFMTDSNGEVILTFFVSNFDYRRGGLTKEIKIQETKKYKSVFFRKVGVFGIVSGVLFTIVLYCMILFIVTKDKANFYLSIFTSTILSRVMFEIFPMTKFFLPEITFSVMLRIEYLAPMLAPGIFTLYLDSLNKNIFKFCKSWILALPSFVFVILDIVLPVKVLNTIVPAFEIWLYLSTISNLIFVFINMFKQRDMITYFTVATLIIIGLGGLTQILLLYGIDISNGHSFLAEAFILYAVMQITLLAWIQNRNMIKQVELNNYLEEVNKSSYRFVPKELITLFNKQNITELKAGEMHSSDMAILSADIRNFTAISEQHSEYHIFEMLNSYLKQIAPIIRKNNGLIEKYLGDGIIAIFPGNVMDSLSCAIEMQEQMVNIRNEFSQKGFPEIKIGIGIHYGQVIIGTGGNNDRITEIAISQDIDKAIETEAKTKIYKRPVLVTKQVFLAMEQNPQIKNYSFRKEKILEEEDLYYIFNNITGDVL